MKALFNHRSEVTIERLHLFVEDILGSAAGSVQPVQSCVQLHQLIVAEFRIQGHVIVGVVDRTGALDHFIGPVFGSVYRSMRELTLADVPTPAHFYGLVRFRDGPDFLCS
jgi:hypothetical protein